MVPGRLTGMWQPMAAPSDSDPKSRFSLRLSLDLTGHQRLYSWQRLVALVAAVVSPLLLEVDREVTDGRGLKRVSTSDVS